MTNQVILDEAVEAALISTYGNPRNGNELVWQSMRAALEAAAPHMAAQALRDAVEAFPLETITAPDNAVMWLRRRADEIGGEA